jgi:hypothetical protein
MKPLVKVRLPTAKGTIAFKDRKKGEKNFRKSKHKKKIDHNKES